MPQIEMPNILGQFLQGQQAGEAQRRKRTLGDFLQPALGGDQAALAKVYSVDPDAGLQVQGMGQKQQTADRETMLADLQQSARLYSSAPPEIKQHLYGKIVDLTEKVGIAPSGALPRQHDPALDEGFNKFLAGIAGPVEDNTPSSIRELQMLQSNPELAALDMKRRTAGFDRPQFHVDADGNGVWLSPGKAPIPVGASATQPSLGPAISNPNAQGFDSLHASVPGLRVTSGTRTPEQNNAAGGVPNSFHLTGQAIDIGRPSPEQLQGINEWASQNNYEVIKNYKDGHVHLEPRGRPPQSAGIKFPTKGNASTEDKAANWQIVQGNDGSMYRVNKLTGQKEAVGVTGSNAARVEKMEQERLEKVQGIQGSIAQTKTALDSIDTLLNAPGLDRAVGFGSMFPTAPGTDSANFEAQLDTFKAQTFVPMVAQLKGMGALSDAEGKKLSEAVGALNIKMSPTAFRNSLNNIKAVLGRAEAAANRKILEINQAASGQYRGQDAPPQRAVPASPTQFTGFRVLD